MDTELSYDQVSNLLPAYVIGALEPEEMLAVDTYLSNNRALLARLQEIELTVAQMSYIAPDAPLPADAKSRLLARVQADLTTQSPIETAAAPQSQPLEIMPAPTQKQTAVSAQTGGWLAEFRQFLSANRWAVVAGCALVAVVALMFYAGQLQTRLRQVTAQSNVLQTEINQLLDSNAELLQTNESLRRELQTNQSELQQASTTLDSLQAEAAELRVVNGQLKESNQSLQQQAQTDQELLGLVTTAERTVFLPGTDESPQASGELYLSGADQAVLVLRGLEPLAADRTYQLWLIPTDSPPQPADLLAVQADGPSWLIVTIPAEARDFAAVGVSVEPAGGSPVLSGPILLLGAVG